MDLQILLLLAGGFVLLVGGAEALVRGASRLAAAFGIPPLVVGLTVVAFGTSSPELAVSVASAWRGNGDIAFGNVVGSNVFNVLAILGISALVRPLVAARAVVRVEAPLMIATAGLAWLAGADGEVSRVEGILLAAGLLGYLAWQVRETRQAGGATPEAAPDAAPDASPEAGDKASRRPGSKAARVAVDVVLIAAGLALLVLGSRWLVEGAVALARNLGVSDLVIAVTIVAAGTSLPEVATSLLASYRGQVDIAVGNVVGSSIFNVLCVLGLSAAVAPGPIAVSRQALVLDAPFMTGAALVAWVLMVPKARLERWHGAVLAAGYVGYVALVLAAV